MKYIICLLFYLITIKTTSAQHHITQDMRYKKNEGRYGSNSGVCLFEDGTFLLYGFATGVFGTYKFEKDYLLFYPDKQELFMVFGHHNPNLNRETQINFVGFERGSKTFVQFDNDSLQKVFNDDANCFDAPFVFKKVGKIKNFTLADIPQEPSQEDDNSATSWHYRNEAEYNDFILIYNAPKREYEDFSAMVSPTENGDVLKLSNYGGDKGYQKQKLDEDEISQWKEILDWKKQYDESKVTNQNIVYANKHYNTFPEPDASKYKFNAVSNQYSNTTDKDNDAYYNQNQYIDSRFLRKYIKLQAETKDRFKNTNTNIASKSIFFTVCGEGSEKSYHYDGFIKEKNNNPPMLETTAPVKLSN